MTILVRDSQLWSLLQSDENDKIEFKSSELLTNPDGENRYKIAKEIVGFANHNGGKIIFGVNDSGKPEGSELFEEDCLSTISEIIAERCSPTVDFSHEFYSENKGNISEGAILVLNISEKVSSPPVAIIENSDGKIRKREYRMRSGESTRLVSDGELLALFNHDHELKIKETIDVWYTHDEDLNPSNISPSPLYYERLSPFYENIENKDELIDVLQIEDEDEERIDHQRLFIHVLCLSILGNISTMDKSKLVEKNETENSYSSSFGYDFEYISGCDVDNRSESNEVYEKLPTNIEAIVDSNEFAEKFDFEQGLFLPETANITIEDEYSKIKIYVENEFELEIALNWRSTVTGYPDEHPKAREFGLGILRKGIMPDFENIENPEDLSEKSIEVEIIAQAEFSYPEQSQEEYESSKLYCEQVIDSIKSTYNWNNFIEILPNKKFYDIERQLDEIKNKLEDSADQES